MSTVIKAAGPVRAIDGGSFNFEDMGDRATGYLDKVRAQAGEILAQARQEAVAIRRDAQEQGRADALRATEQILAEQLGRQLTTLLPAVKEAVERIHAAKAQWLTHWEQMGVRVAAAIAGRLIRRELAQDPQITLSLVREALELAAGSGDVQLRLHPDDHAAIGPQAQRLISELSRLGTAQIVADPEISPGGCRVDTRFGSIDQQFEAQLARIEEELT